MKILIAEDERASRARIVAYLRAWGHEPIAVANGEEAWQVLQEQRIALVITDWLMPELDGPGLIRRVRSAKFEVYTYFIMLTSRSEKEALVEGMEAGADDFIVKPFDQEELRVRIRAGERVISLEHALAQRNKQLQSVNTRMKNQLNAAARIQHSYLPPKTLNIPGADFSWIYEPCEELGGDTLNIIPFDSTHIGIYVLDVSGHGVSSALLSVHLSRILTRLDEADGILRKHGTRELHPPSEVVASLNTKFADHLASGQFFTLLYGILDLAEKTFTFTSAGHPGPVLVSGNTTRLLDPTPPAIGFVAEAQFIEQTINLKSGDRLILFSDGIFEVENDSNELWGEDRLAEACTATRRRTIAESLSTILKAAADWNGKKNPWPDDISLLGVSIH